MRKIIILITIKIMLFMMVVFKMITIEVVNTIALHFILFYSILFIYFILILMSVVWVKWLNKEKKKNQNLRMRSICQGYNTAATHTLETHSLALYVPERTCTVGPLAPSLFKMQFSIWMNEKLNQEQWNLDGKKK